MEYTTIPRSLIYKDRDNLNEFGVKTPGTVNYYLFSNLKDIYMASNRAKELILRCFNNAYYICTLIPFEDFPDMQVAEYESLLLKDDSYACEEVCALSMALVAKLMEAYDAQWRGENNELTTAIQYRFTHYQWMHSGISNDFKRMIAKNNTDGLILPPSEFAPRDIIEVIENSPEWDLWGYAEYICERLALLKDPRQRMYGADMAIGRLKDYQRELCEETGYNPKKDSFDYSNGEGSPLARDLSHEKVVRNYYQESQEGIEYYTEHYPKDKSCHHEEQTDSKVSTSDNEALVVENEQLKQQLAQCVSHLNEQKEANKKLKGELEKREAEEERIRELESQLKEANTLPENVTAQQRVRMELARKIMEKAGIDKNILDKWGKKDKAGTLMGTMLDIKPATCKTYLSDPCLNTDHHKETIDKINPLIEALELDFRL